MGVLHRGRVRVANRSVKTDQGAVEPLMKASFKHTVVVFRMGFEVAN